MLKSFGVMYGLDLWGRGLWDLGFDSIPANRSLSDLKVNLCVLNRN